MSIWEVIKATVSINRRLIIVFGYILWSHNFQLKLGVRVGRCISTAMTPRPQYRRRPDYSGRLRETIEPHGPKALPLVGFVA